MAGRMRVVREFRHLLAMEGGEVARELAERKGRPVAEGLTAEVIPLAEAAKWLEGNAAKVLKPRVLGRRGRPIWLGGVATEVRREPMGVVLVVGPGNYPLFLPAAQALQALAAGNAVWIKPAPGCSGLMERFARMLGRAGLDRRLVRVLPEEKSSLGEALRLGVDKVVFTGSARSGRAILGELAEWLVPSVMELSGCDAAHVRADADPELVVRALVFGARLNAGATCIAPRRVYVARSLATELEGRLAEEFGKLEPIWIRHRESERARPLIQAALAGGGHVIAGGPREDGSFGAPLVLGGVDDGAELLREDLFLPILSLHTVASDEESIAKGNLNPYALGAAVFGGDRVAAEEMAGRINAGVVVVNDMIVPSADPRAPFGGRGRSGFGLTRGPEGLLEMTVAKVVASRRGGSLAHLEPPREGDAGLFEAFLKLGHARGWGRRWEAAREVWRAVVERGKSMRK